MKWFALSGEGRANAGGLCFAQDGRWAGAATTAAQRAFVGAKKSRQGGGGRYAVR